MAKSLLSFLSPLTGLRSLIEREIQKVVKSILRRALLGMMAGVFLLLSTIFISLGLVEGFSLIVARWAAYCIVGLILAVIGLVLLSLSLLRR